MKGPTQRRGPPKAWRDSNPRSRTPVALDVEIGHEAEAALHLLELTGRASKVACTGAFSKRVRTIYPILDAWPWIGRIPPVETISLP